MENLSIIIPSALIGAAVADAIPTPADALYFKKQQEIKQQLIEGKIDVATFWKKEVFYYYTLNAIYWGAIAGITYSLSSNSQIRLKVLLTLVAAGAVIGVLTNNIKKDKMLLNETIK